MDANSLRTLLLVKAVEEHDDTGALLPAADRDAATRAALRRWPLAPGSPAGRDLRIEHARRVAVGRAQELYGRLAERHPVIGRTMRLESYVTRTSWWILLAAFLCGLVLSVVDSRVRIEIVAFPLLGVIVWNLLVYALLLLRALRRARPDRGLAGPGGWFVGSARWGWRRAQKMIKAADFYHRSLAAALREFSDEWWRVAHPLLVRNGERVFHFAAAALALGLVAGFYLRGVGLEYRAGWESTFLGPTQVRQVVRLLYGPASLLTGLALPSSPAAIEALHWRGGAGGGPAAQWIHLMAATAFIFVIVPRVLLGAFAGFAVWRAARSVAVPESVVPYIRRVLAASDAALPAAHIRVIPYAYSPDDGSLRGAERLLHAVFGTDARIAFADIVPYGEEGALQERLDSADLQVLLLSLAATPEAENHGVILATARDHALRSSTATRLLVLIDESPYLQRMRGDPSLAGRIEERRQAWRNFAAAHAVKPCISDLKALATDDATVAAATMDEARTAVLTALA